MKFCCFFFLQNEKHTGWNQDDLPSDPVSVENGCIVTASMRFPLMIDPQLQGIKWIKKKEKSNHLSVIRMDQKDALRKLEHSMENGHSLLIENLGALFGGGWWCCVLLVLCCFLFQ